MSQVWRVFAFVFAGLLGSSALPALADCDPAPLSGPMQFSLAQAAGPIGSERSVWIIARGRVSDRTANEFSRFLSQIGEHPAGVMLQSNGGRLMEGLALGREIRAAGLATRVAELADCAEDSDGQSRETTAPKAQCLSSCAYAFLGGVTREVGSGELGFHRISPAASQANLAPELMQAVLAEADRLLQAYVTEMGANPSLPHIAAMIDETSVYIPNRGARITLGIDTGPGQIAGVGQGLLTQG